MRRFNANKKRVLRELLNDKQPTPFRTIRGFNKLFGTNTSQTYNILNDLDGVVVLPNPNMNVLRQLLYNSRGNSIRVSYLIDGQDVLFNNAPVDRNIQVPNFATDQEFADWFAVEYWRWRDNTETDIFQDYEFQGKLYSRPQTSLANTERIKQSFLDGLSHCVFTPIIKWATDCLASAESDSSKKRYNAKLNKIKKYLKIYEKGVPEENIEELCKNLNIKICIYYPFSDEENIYGEKLKHPDKVFKYTNTRFNHLDFGNLISNEKPVRVSRDSIYQKIDELDNNKEFYYTTKDNRGYNAVFTINGSWSCVTAFQEVKEDFEQKNGLCNMKVCDIKNAELASFIKRGTHYNTSFSSWDGYEESDKFTTTIIGDNKYINEKNHTTKLIDQKKAYYNFKKCSYYEGFLGKITDFRKTDKIVGVGLYLITDIKIRNKRLENLNNKMKWFKSNNVYTSAELKVLDKMKSTYKIIAGCWGIEPLHFEFGEEFLKKTDTKPFVNENGELSMKGISYYAKTTGAWDSHNTHSFRYIKGSQEYAQVLKNNSNNIICKYNDEDEICIGIQRKTILTLGHISAFIFSYQRISLMEQLLEMDLNKIIGVFVDGIYYKEHSFKLLDTFDKKEIDSSVCFRNEGFLTNIFETRPKLVYSSFRDNYKTELFIGAGGNGKTHYNLMDKGLINVLYVAPSHKLNANKKAEYNVDVEVLASLLTDNPMNYRRIMYYNNIIFDEVSMMSNEEKEILMKKYQNHKLIFCGDVGFQLPCISTSEEPKSEIKLEEFDNIQEFTTNYRCKDTKLLEILNYLRDKIKNGSITIPNNIIEKFYNGELDFVKEKYKVDDMIICGTNKAKDLYTKMFENMKKWYITKNTEYYNNGDIIIQEEQPDKSAVIRHAYTAHSIQGETANNKLYIDINTLQDIRAFYTAVSRAKSLKQIFMVSRTEDNSYEKVCNGKCHDCGVPCNSYYRCRSCHFAYKGWADTF